MLFNKNKKLTMPPDKIKALANRSIKYAVLRDSETYIETRVGENGAINIIGGEFVLVCGGKNIIRAKIGAVKIAELMNLSGITIKGINLDDGKEKNIIAYFSDGQVKVK